MFGYCKSNLSFVYIASCAPRKINEMSDVQSSSDLSRYLWIKIAFYCAAVLCGVICIPRLHKHRQHPVLKYRTFPIYILAVISSFTVNIIDLIKSEIPELSVTAYRALSISDALAYSLLNGAIAGIGIRFYSLILTRYVQGQLMDRRTCYDGVFYRRVASQIRWCRFFTFESTAIKSAIVHSFLFAIISATPYCVASDGAIKSVIQGEPSFLRMWSGSSSLVVSILMLGS